jgi:hypothetical protein
MRSLPSAVLLALSAARADPAAATQDSAPDIALFLQAASRDERAARTALRKLSGAWRDGYSAMIVELASLVQRSDPPPPVVWAPLIPRSTDAPPDEGGIPPTASPLRADVRGRLLRFLARRTGQRFGQDIRRWQRWVWQQPYEPHPDYAAFKRAVLGRIDERMGEFFPPGVPARIRLDEVVWGGVTVNGIPPLDHPETVSAEEASYLADGNVVFGVEIRGEARAYPRRILAWHEMARDRLGGADIALAYCTLCEAVIPYRSEAGGRSLTFGTSGLLYRSNKLMFDDQTRSLWSALTGVALVGPMARLDLELEKFPVVTTTWAEWRASHPETTVLSLDTGYERNYAEGEAYREYGRSDRLWFEVPDPDERLKNKAEVLVMRIDSGGGDEDRTPVAVAVERLKRNPVYHLSVGERRLVIVTSEAGANRVYDAGHVRFVRRVGDEVLEDDRGRRWRVTEQALVIQRGEGERRPRVPAHRAFWFGWHAQFPETVLIR